MADISKARVQIAVMNAETKGPKASFDELCQTVADSSFGKSLGLSAADVGKLIREHGVITKTTQPAAPAPVPVKVDPQPEPEAAAPKRRSRKPKEEDVEPESAAPIQTSRMVPISTPSGHCPVKLEGKSVDQVVAWADKVRGHGERNARWYQRAALIYWVREFYDLHGPDYQEVKDIIQTEVGE